MQVTSILWFILGLFVIGLGINSIRLFSIDKDTRKLLYGLGLSFSSLSFLLFSGGYLNSYARIDENIFLHTIYLWSGIVYLTLIFHVLIEGLFPKRIKIKKSIYSFLIFSLLSFVLIYSGIVDKEFYITAMWIGTSIVIMLGIFYTIRFNRITSYLFLFSIFSILIASSQIQLIINGDFTAEFFSLFAYFIGYIFIGFIFLKNLFNPEINYGIESFFSIEKQLQSTKKELSETKEMFKDLFDQMIDSVIIVDRKGTVLEASNRFFSDLKVTREETIGKNLFSFSFIDTKTKRLLIKNILLRLAGKYIPPYEIMVSPNKGEPIPYEVHAGKIQYKGKSADMAVFRDLRERKKTEKLIAETELKYKTIVEKSGTAVITFNDTGIITMANSKFASLTGYQKDEIEQKMNWYDFVIDEDKKRMLEYHRQRSRKTGNPPSEYDCCIIDRSGTIKTVHTSIGLIPDSSTRIVSVMDITPLKKMQDELRTVNMNLELTVNQRTDQIQQLLKQKDGFINQLGHDLKNPLGPLLNLIPLLERKETDPKYKEMLVVMRRNIQYMKNLVVKTIELAKLNSQSIKFMMKRMDASQSIHLAISSNQFLFQEKQIDVINFIKEPIMIEADPLRIQEVFVNVLSNAVKYSSKGGRIVIDGVDELDQVTFSVKDTGMGMTKKQMSHIFDEFYKADESRHDFDSTGLGMPICKRIVEKHEGRIWVESDGIGKGSIFYIQLPKRQTMNRISDEDISDQDMYQRIDTLIA